MAAGNPDKVLGSMPLPKAGLSGSSVSALLSREGSSAFV